MQEFFKQQTVATPRLRPFLLHSAICLLVSLSANVHSQGKTTIADRQVGRFTPTWCQTTIDRTAVAFRSKSEIVQTIKFKDNGSTAQSELQQAINDAHLQWKINGQLTVLQLQQTGIPLFSIQIDKPISIRSGVYLDGSGIILSATKPISNMIQFSTKTQDAGVSSFHLLGNNGTKNLRITHSIIRVRESSNNIDVINNQLVGENNSLRQSQDYGSDIWGIAAHSGTSNLLIANNDISWTPTGIVIVAKSARITDVSIVKNHIEHYRRRAIYVVSSIVDGTENIHISNNLIDPPASLNGSKQPIAFQIAKNGSHLKPLVYNNRINGVAEPHIRGKSNRGSADNISLHRTTKAMVSHNCVANAGELGINLSLGTTDSAIECNYVLASDLSGINVQSSRKFKEPIYRSSKISISHNIIEQAGVNADKHRPAVVGGIYLDQVDEITLSSNHVTDSADVGAAIYIRDSEHVSLHTNRFTNHPPARDVIRLERAEKVVIDGRAMISPHEKITTVNSVTTSSNTIDYCTASAKVYSKY